MGKCVLEIRDEVNVRFQGLDVKQDVRYPMK